MEDLRLLLCVVSLLPFFDEELSDKDFSLVLVKNFFFGCSLPNCEELESLVLFALCTSLGVEPAIGSGAEKCGLGTSV